MKKILLFSLMLTSIVSHAMDDNEIINQLALLVSGDAARMHTDLTRAAMVASLIIDKTEQLSPHTILTIMNQANTVQKTLPETYTTITLGMSQELHPRIKILFLEVIAKGTVNPTGIAELDEFYIDSGLKT
ncbi:MAG: hypothetical protein M1114_06370 [Candidatus Dependentiae bacterium]|nr:hypothetical protein [Candidatus Dependentiae bacterium]